MMNKNETNLGYMNLKASIKLKEDISKYIDFMMYGYPQETKAIIVDYLWFEIEDKVIEMKKNI